MKLGFGLGINQRAENLESMSGFSIDSLSGLVAWYPFNTGHTLDGDALVAWADASGNSRTLTNTGATNKRPTVESGRINWGDVPNSFMDIQNGAIPNSRAFSLFFVVEFAVANATAISRILNGSSSSSSTDTFTWATLTSTHPSQLWQLLMDGFGDTTTRVSTSTTNGNLANNTKTIIQCIYGGGSTDGDNTFKIDTQTGSGTLTNCLSLSKTNSNDETLDFNAVGLNSSSQYIHGYVDEIVIFNRKLNTEEATEVRTDMISRNNM